MPSSQHRALVRLAGVAAAASLVIAIAGFRRIVPEDFAFIGLGLFVAFLVLIAALAWRSRQQVLAQRDTVERGQMIVIMAAQLRDEDTVALEQMVRRGGSAGEAAALILQGRAERERRHPGSAP